MQLRFGAAFQGRNGSGVLEARIPAVRSVELEGKAGRRERARIRSLRTEKNTMAKSKSAESDVVRILNKILEMELAGVVRYTHYSFMVFGHARIPIVSWLRSEATKSMAHAQKAGEIITLLGEHPSLSIGPLLETHKHRIDEILRESLVHERATLELYRELLKVSEGKSVMLEEYARELIYEEELDAGAVDKMLRAPGAVAAFST
jgi:bacterioferritin